MNWIISAAKTFHESHERLKHRVHTAWRYPLPPWGRAVMSFVYFSIPVVGGYQVMQWAISRAHDSIGEKGEKLAVQQIEGIGDKRIKENGDVEKVGAGGIGMGVRLAVSDEKTQQQNKQMLEAFFRKERKRRKLKEQSQQQPKEKEHHVLQDKS